MLKYSCLFVSCTLIAGVSLWGSPEIDLIDRKISELQKELHNEQNLESNAQVESQEHFIADWPKYSQDVEKIKKLDERNSEIEREIHALEKRKAELLQKAT